MTCGGIAALERPMGTSCNYELPNKGACAALDFAGQCRGMPEVCEPGIGFGPQTRACGADLCTDECELIKQSVFWHGDNNLPSVTASASPPAGGLNANMAARGGGICQRRKTRNLVSTREWRVPAIAAGVMFHASVLNHCTLYVTISMLPDPIMNPSIHEVLVAGATGRQGGAVIRHLGRHGYALRALCRDPESTAARSLAQSGVRVMRGDLDDRSSLDAAVDGAQGVFSVTSFWDTTPGSLRGPEREARQGKNLLDAAKAAGVAHVVQASGAGVTIAPGLAVNRGKLEVEEHGRSLGLPLTILRSVFFMDNFDDPVMGLGEPIRQGRLDMAFDPEMKLQMIAVEDIGHLVAMAFDGHPGIAGTRLDVAGDELTMTGIADTLARVIGHPVRYTGSSERLGMIRQVDGDLADLFESVNATGFKASVPAVRALHPEMLTFEGYLRRAGWEARHAA